MRVPEDATKSNFNNQNVIISCDNKFRSEAVTGLIISIRKMISSRTQIPSITHSS